MSQKSNDQELWKIAGVDYFFIYEGDKLARLERFELPALGTGIRLCTIRVAYCFSILLYFKVFCVDPFSSVFLHLVLSLEQNWSKNLGSF